MSSPVRIGTAIGIATVSVVWSVVCSASIAGAQPAVITGRVVDPSDRPLRGATVTFDDTEITATTDDAGVYLIRVDFVDSGRVLFRKVGYAPAAANVRLVRGDTLRLITRLGATQTLDAVRTVAAMTPSVRLAGFEARRLSGHGVFITRADIEKRASISAADVVRWSGAVRVVDSGGMLLPVSNRGVKMDRARRTFDAPCVMRVAIDGHVMPAGFSLGELPSPKELEGVEIFKGPSSLPPEFASSRADAYCGLVSVWTRAR